ncbi:hypothetical protein [Stappia sp. MMSF_3263]|uniref:hypothetical protein n=1 Tax=Stappia sp. MMSF_3263 TaxID=3046693 RepID=UPI00273E97EE|nr:hypothetical protein [Stappia sp. MMSF_3263]
MPQPDWLDPRDIDEIVAQLAVAFPSHLIRPLARVKLNIAGSDIQFDAAKRIDHTKTVVIAHAEPVQVWGLEPCGNLEFPSQSRRLAGTVAARRTRWALGAAYSRSNVAEQPLCFYGRRHSCRRKQRTIPMSKEDRHQRRRRRLTRAWLFKLIVGLGQAAYYVARFWFWLSDRQ